MGQAITTAMMVIASIIAAIALINAVLPAMGKSSSALAVANKDAAERIKTDVEIIHATGDVSGTVTVWVKNIGAQVIRLPAASDIIVTKPSGSVARLPYEDGCNSECWDYILEDSATFWKTAVTVKFTLTTAVAVGSYSITVAVSNGVSATKDFSV